LSKYMYYIHMVAQYKGSKVGILYFGHYFKHSSSVLHDVMPPRTVAPLKTCTRVLWYSVHSSMAQAKMLWLHLACEIA